MKKNGLTLKLSLILVIAAFLIAAAATAVSALPQLYFDGDVEVWHPAKFEWEAIPRDDDVVLRLAMGADIHFGQGGYFSAEKLSAVYEACEIFGGVDALCIAGDLNHYGEVQGYEDLMAVVREYTKELTVDVDGYDASCSGSAVGTTILSMGNHEMYTMHEEYGPNWERFRECVGQEPTKLYWLGGVPIVKMSPDNAPDTEGSNSYHGQEAEILAIFDEIDRSGYDGIIIGMAHHRVPTGTGTVSNSTWTEAELNCFKAHPKLVLFTGHSHTYIYNTRDVIEQDLGFTHVRSGVLGIAYGGDYVNPNNGKSKSDTTYNGSADVCSFHLIDIKSDGTVIDRRFDIAKGEPIFGGEDFIIDPSRDFGIYNGKKYVNYYSRSKNAGTYGNGCLAPVFTEDAAVSIGYEDNHDTVIVSFPRAFPASDLARDAIVRYEIVLTDSAGGTIQSNVLNDQYLSQQHETWSVPVPGLSPDTDYTVEVRAVAAYEVASSIGYEGTVNVGHVEVREPSLVLGVDFSLGDTSDLTGRETVASPARPKIVYDETIGRSVFQTTGGVFAYEFDFDDLDNVRTDFSIEAYFKPRFTNSDPQFVVGSIDGLAAGLRIEDGKLWFWGMFRSAGAAGENRYVAGADIDQNKWYHAVATYDGVTARLYLNGELAAEANVSGGIYLDVQDEHSVCVGESTDGPGFSYPFMGSINYAKLYSGVIDADGVAAAYERAQRKNASAVFSDLEEDAWYARDVDSAYKFGLMNGTDESVFSPDGEMTRAMFATVLWRAAGSPAPASPAPFGDLGEDWYRDAAAWAYGNGIVLGVSADAFSPDGSLTREQAVTMLCRFAGYQGVSTEASGGLDAFPDADKVSGWAVDSFRWAVGSGLVVGVVVGGEDLLLPAGVLDRAQTAALAVRYLEGAGGEIVSDRTVNLSDGVAPSPVEAVDDLTAGAAALRDFASRLFRGSYEEGVNTLVSPLSVYYALAMAQNGAVGATRAQMEDVLGMSVEDANAFLHTYAENLPVGEKYKLLVANSVWFTSAERFTVNQDFLHTNADYYGADIFKAPFNEQTLRDINGWVNEKTEGMIPEILDNIPPQAVMYIANALCFEADWEEKYTTDAVVDGTFTAMNGEKREVEMLRSEESKYFEDKGTAGFVKYYADRGYAFAAFLPAEDYDFSEFVASLDGDRIAALLDGMSDESVFVTMPKFETEYDTELSAVLKQMGMKLPFDEDRAELSGLGHSAAGRLFFSRVLHKTFISVTETGTRAGAATIIEIRDKAGPHEGQKTIVLDRPFVYMLIDTAMGTPFFIGAMCDVG